MNNYDYYVICNTKFEFSSFPSLDGMTPQRYPSHGGNKSSNSGIYPRKTGLTCKK